MECEISQEAFLKGCRGHANVAKGLRRAIETFDPLSKYSLKIHACGLLLRLFARQKPKNMPTSEPQLLQDEPMNSVFLFFPHPPQSSNETVRPSPKCLAYLYKPARSALRELMHTQSKLV